MGRTRGERGSNKPRTGPERAPPGRAGIGGRGRAVAPRGPGTQGHGWAPGVGGSIPTLRPPPRVAWARLADERGLLIVLAAKRLDTATVSEAYGAPRKTECDKHAPGWNTRQSSHCA